MPFDPLRDSRITTILPPTEHGGGPQRIRIEIEIVDRRAITQARGYRFGTLTLWLLVALLALGLFGR